MEERRETNQEFVCINQPMNLDWDQINWDQIKHRVETLQQRIFLDTQDRNFRMVSQTQKLLTRSLSARLWAVRLIIEINGGKNTPGIDGKLYQTIEEKIQYVESLKFRIQDLKNRLSQFEYLPPWVWYHTNNETLKMMMLKKMLH